MTKKQICRARRVFVAYTLFTTAVLFLLGTVQESQVSQSITTTTNHK